MFSILHLVLEVHALTSKDGDEAIESVVRVATGTDLISCPSGDQKSLQSSIGKVLHI
jgi:hypothetical protein